jgi:hypothetical protein
MITGLCIVLMGLLVIIYPQLLAILFGGLLVLFGLGMMAASWQFRKLKRQSDSRFINWIIRF